jgi:hypothetical protein
MPRREFTPMVYAEIVRRAMDANGQLWCEGCGELIKGKLYEVDHTIADGLILDKKRKLTAADGKLLGKKCCHGPKSKDDVARIAKAKRVEAIHLNIKTREKQPIRSPGFAKPAKAKQASRWDWAPKFQPNLYAPKEETT